MTSHSHQVSWRMYKMTLNLSMIDDDKLRKELEDIICHCDDCLLERYDCNCQYRCLFKLSQDRIEEIIQNSRVKLSIENDEKDSQLKSPKGTFNELL